MSWLTWTPSWGGWSIVGAACLSTPNSASWTSGSASSRDEAAALGAREGDLKREQAKADADVEQVRSRIARDRSRLDAGQVNSPRELENLQSEIESLLRRQSDLEDVELDVMERLSRPRPG